MRIKMAERRKEQNYARPGKRGKERRTTLSRLVRLVRFELTTPCLKGKCYYPLSYNRVFFSSIFYNYYNIFFYKSQVEILENQIKFFVEEMD